MELVTGTDAHGDRSIWTNSPIALIVGIGLRGLEHAASPERDPPQTAAPMADTLKNSPLLSADGGGG
jgi:hypothetical protein